MSKSNTPYVRVKRKANKRKKERKKERKKKVETYERKRLRYTSDDCYLLECHERKGRRKKETRRKKMQEKK